MYKLLLCWRYLRTRYIAMASIVSVTLGVATMIVVNAVMSGFTAEMRDRIHNTLSDVVFESRSLEGMPDFQEKRETILKVAGEDIEAMTPVVVIPGMMSFRFGEQYVTRQVHVIGIDQVTQGQVSAFRDYLQHLDNRSGDADVFELHHGGFDTRQAEAKASGGKIKERTQLRDAGWQRREFNAMRAEIMGTAPSRSRLEPARDHNGDGWEDDGAMPMFAEQPAAESPNVALGTDFGLEPTEATETVPNDAFASYTDPVDAGDDSAIDFYEGADAPPAVADSFGSLSDMASSNAPGACPFPIRDNSNPGGLFDPRTMQHTGIVMGIGLTCRRNSDGTEDFLLLPGDDVQITIPTAGTPPKGVSDAFTVVDFYESKMSEFDSLFVFVPLSHLQDLRGMIDPTTGARMVTQIQIKVKDGVNPAAVRDKLRAAFPGHLYLVSTWRDKQGALLAAVDMEMAVLNVLLFLIIAVAGFGILAIFLMIVVEKTRDIGILKALGASSQGVMAIFMTYGLLLGLVGSGIGMVAGLIFVANINEIADFIGWIKGEAVFDPSIYYFYRIPTIIEPFTVFWIMAGATAIATAASVFPALRAAMLRPVEALRYE